MKISLRMIKSAYKTVVRFARQIRPNRGQNGNILFRNIKGMILTCIDRNFVYTRINQAKDGVQQAKLNVPIDLQRYPWKSNGPQNSQKQGPTRYDFAVEQAFPNQRSLEGGHSQNQNQNPDGFYRVPIKLDWQPIKMSIREFKRMRILTRESFKNQVKKMISPTKSILVNKIKRNCRYLLCHKPAKTWYTCYQEKIHRYIEGLRYRVLATYNRLDDYQKKIWKVLIDQSFGHGYTETHLDNAQLIQ